MLADFFNNGIPGWILALVAAGFLIYAVLWVWTHIASDLLLQNLARTNRVDLPRLGRAVAVPTTGVAGEESTALVLARSNLPINPDQPASRDTSNVIYPVAGRNGINFAPVRCTGCNLCVYVCPTGAISTHENETGYRRRFDLRSCVYCGLCESACPTTAIRLTFNPQPAQAEVGGLVLESQLEATPCRLCDRKAAQADLLAERIYELNTVEAEDEPDEEEYTRLRQAINPNGLCLECQKRVLEAEEQICA